MVGDVVKRAVLELRVQPGLGEAAGLPVQRPLCRDRLEVSPPVRDLPVGRRGRVVGPGEC